MDRIFRYGGLPDLIFFPLMLLVAGGMVLGAMSVGIGRPPSGPIGGGNTDYRLITVEGAQLSRIQSGGEPVNLIRIGEGDDMIVRVLAQFGELSDRPEAGPHFKIAPDLEARFSHRTLEVTITARAASEAGAKAMLVNYSTGSRGDSGWLRFDLGEEFSDYRFTYDVPEAEAGYSSFDYLAIKPEVLSKSGAVDISKVVFRPVARWR